jgi:hypothetical protein
MTPGEIHPGDLFAIVDGREVDLGYEDKPDAGWLTFSLSGRVETRSETPDGIGRVFEVKAINLPMVLAVEVATKKPAVIDTRKVVMRGITKEYAAAYFRLFRVNAKAK